MMNRLDRMQAILIQLQGKQIVRAQEIADRFQISLRTVYRDIRSLEESGVPIGAEAGIGYFLAENYTLPPIMFSNREASALIFGEKLIEKMSDDGVRRDFESAIMKIRAILRPTEKELFEKIDNSITVLNSYSQGRDVSRNFLYEIQHAIANKRVLQLTYQALNRNDSVIRQIEPIGLCNYSAHWHLIGWCRLRSDYRDFRVDRISNLKTLDEGFQDKKLMSLDEYVKSYQNSMEGEPNIAIVVKNESTRYMGDTKFWYGFVREEPVGEDKIRMYFANNELRGFAAWLLNTGCMAEIEKPDSLLDIIKSFVMDSYNNYFHP